MIKYSSIKANILYDELDYIDIKGVTDHIIRSLGSTNSTLNINGFELTQKLYIVPDEFNIPSDGILGKDFLKRFQCTINYSNMTLTIHTDIRKIILNILEGPEDNTIVIPPHCEVIRNFIITTKENTARYVPTQELTKGVYTSNTIIDPKEAFVRIINTTNKTQTIHKNKIETHSLNEYTVYSFDKVNPKRNSKLINLLTNKVPKHVTNDFAELCSQFTVSRNICFRRRHYDSKQFLLSKYTHRRQRTSIY